MTVTFFNGDVKRTLASGKVVRVSVNLSICQSTALYRIQLFSYAVSWVYLRFADSYHTAGLPLC